MAEWGSILKMVALLSLLYVALFCTACMRSGQTVRWISSEPSQGQSQALWIGCQNLQEDDVVIAVGGSQDNLHCQITSPSLSEESPGSK